MVNIRKGKLSDSENIVEFQLRMANETENLQLSRETVTKGVQGIFDQPCRGTYWIAEKKGKISGMLLATPEWSDWRNGTVLWIHSLYVCPVERGKGIFKKLYMNLKNQVQQSQNLIGLRLYADKRNKQAQMVYEKLGMTKEHYETFEWLK